MFTAPRYGHGTIADVFPSVLAALDVPGETDRLGLTGALEGIDRVAVLLVDGLGAHQLDAHRELAPTLSGADRARTIETGFPSTTAVSLGSLGTGLAPGGHGITGYLMRLPGYDRPFAPLSWRLHGAGEKTDLRTEFTPEGAQPAATVFERAAAAGLAVTRVAPGYQATSGLTRAVLRGGEFTPAFSAGDLAAGTVLALQTGGPGIVYAYHGDLDLTGHARGPDSAAWRAELAHVDLLVAQIVAGLPAGAALVVTADHGMVEVRDPIDLDAEEVFGQEVAMIGGEPRARHVYTLPGAAERVARRWADRLGPDYLVCTGAEAIETGWFGEVAETVRGRIGDVLALPTGDGALLRRATEPVQSRLIGHHGSLTEVERRIPLLVFRS